MTLKAAILATALLALPLSSAPAATAPPAPYGATPSPAQNKHAEREFYAFCHFTTNTFTGVEWGLGSEPESTYNPNQFNAGQIVGAVKAADMKGLILTCKHHDGFCLWPTKTTEHSVAHSPYQNGKGDILEKNHAAVAEIDVIEATPE